MLRFDAIEQTVEIGDAQPDTIKRRDLAAGGTGGKPELDSGAKLLLFPRQLGDGAELLLGGRMRDALNEAIEIDNPLPDRL